LRTCVHKYVSMRVLRVSELYGVISKEKIESMRAIAITISSCRR